MAVRSIIAICLILLAILSASGCGSATSQDLETVRFALDSSDWETAIGISRSILAKDPGNVEAALMLSSAYAGKGNFKLLHLAGLIAEIQRKKELFRTMQEGLSPVHAHPDRLADAVDSLLFDLRNKPSEENPYYDDYEFQVGLLMIIEALARSPLIAQPEYDGAIDTSKIDQTTKDRLLRDFKDFDELMIASGLPADDPIVVNGRYTYCVLQAVSGKTDDFDIEVLRDMTKCQLSPDAGAALTRENGDFESPNVNRCTDFEVPACGA